MSPTSPAESRISESISVDGRKYRVTDLVEAVSRLGGKIGEMPYVIRILLENLLRSRSLKGVHAVTDEEIGRLLDWRKHIDADLPLYVSRVILPDSSGVPVLQDLAAMRDAVARAGGDAKKVDTLVPVDLIVDHSLQVDSSGSHDAIRVNMRREFERNAERYAFLGWSQQAFKGLNVYPPGSGIIHQVNLERIASVVATAKYDGVEWAFPDFVIGGDSHTPMVNGIGVLGWGVGGIDAEAALLGHAYTFPVPDVIGVRLIGSVKPSVWTTDVALLITQRLRMEKVANCAVEFFGPAVQALTAPERATLANMAPEYGATCGFFPVDHRTLDYLRTTGRPPSQVALVEEYCRRTGLFREDNEPVPIYSRVVEIDIGEASPSMAGPQRPQDRLALKEIAPDFRRRLETPLAAGGFGSTGNSGSTKGAMPQGAVVIAAITSCTNTSNPQVMIAAGLVARNAVSRGVRPPSWVKTSLAPGSPTVMKYLEIAGLLEPLESLGFHLIGFGCTTCGGKSGPLATEVVQQIEERQLVAAAVLSGNRNFSGRIHKLVRANYIGAPPMVVAYALAGRIDIDLESEPLGRDTEGREVFLRELLPSQEEVQAMLERVATLGAFTSSPSDKAYVPIDMQWKSGSLTGELYPWDPASQYLREPPFFAGLSSGNSISDLATSLKRTWALAAFGDSLTTDHISPGGEIPVETPAGQYLVQAGIAPRDFNSYVGRRGNFEVMARGTFANVRIRNVLTPDLEGGWTLHFPDRKVTTIYDAAKTYQKEGTAVIVLGGKEYGTGSSRDWAAKGSALLGVKAVIAESYERIHRANLIGMGVLPLRFEEGEGWRQLGLDGMEQYGFEGVEEGVREGKPIRVTATRAGGTTICFQVLTEVRTAAERHLMAAGGIHNSVLKDLLEKAPA